MLGEDRIRNSTPMSVFRPVSAGKRQYGKTYFRYGAMGSSKTANDIMVWYN